jgi:hypothetical protein
VPFFQDELFHWLCGERKLKYSIKEYKELFEAVAALRQRLAAPHGQVSADQVEKVGFVVGHLDVLEAPEADQLNAVLAGHVGADGAEANNNNSRAKRVADKASAAAEKEATVAGKKPSGKGKGDGTLVTAPSRKRKAAEPPASSTRKSQRSR